jgi:hypothetical protein
MSFQTQAGIDAEINTKLPSNDTGAVTAAALRQVLHDMNAATFALASSQGLIDSVFRYGAAGDGATDDAGAFNAALAANTYVIAPPASYAIAGAAVVIPAGGTLEAYPGAGMTYSGPGTLLIAPGGAFITKEYGDQHDGWLWARSTSGTRSSTQDPLGMLGRTGSFNFAFVNAADNGQTLGIVNNLVSFQQFGGTTVTGAREALLGYLFQTAATGASNTFRDYVGGVFISETSSGDGGTLGAEQGAYFGGNSQSRLNAGAAHILNATAHEFDVYNASGCSVKWNWGINVVSFNAVQGSSNDSAIVIYSGNGNTYGPGVGFHNGLCFAEIASTGRPPVDSGATLIGTHLETLSSFAAANGVDLRNFTFSNLAFASPGFYVDGFGNVVTPLVSGYPGATYLTLQSSATVSSKILIGNASDPTIYLRANAVSIQDPTGTNNVIEVASGSNAISFLGTATITRLALGSHTTNALGSTASAVADGLVLQNTTAATSGTPVQSSPNIHLIGQGWASGAGASQTVDWIISAQPISGTSAANTLSFNAQINGGGYANVMQLGYPSAYGNGSVLLGGSLTVPSMFSLTGPEDFQLGWQINGSGQIWHMNLNSSGLLYFFDKTNAVYPLQMSPSSGNIVLTSTTAASSVSAAALVVAGGIGVAGTSRICGATFTASGGLQLGTPTGGDLGGGKLNVAGGIYLNNSAYTNPDYVFEHHFTGGIEKYADKPRARDYRGRLAIDDLERHVATHLRFPGIDEEPTDIFERSDIALEKLEEQALYLFELNARIGHLERIATGRG